MEIRGEWEKKILINELTHGYDLAKELQNHLDPSSPAETRASILQKLLCSITKALSMLKPMDSDGEPQPTTPTTTMDSPHSVSGSPGSDTSGQTFRDQERRDISKKRKMLPKWTEKVQVTTGSGLEGPIDDGYSWRKYGQKDILGANYPRGYYRCTHRNVQGCLATKQVQRSDEDPTVFDTVYRGKHTCFPSSDHQLDRTAASSSFPDKQQQPPSAPLPLPLRQQLQRQQPQQLPHPKEILINFKTGLKVKTEDLQLRDMSSMMTSSFSFPPASVESVTPESRLFSPNSNFEGSNLQMGNFSSPFISPATSESNYFSISPCGTMANPSGACNVHTSESELTEIVSAASTSVTNSPMVDLEFHLDPVDFDPNFHFDASGFFA